MHAVMKKNVKMTKKRLFLKVSFIENSIIILMLI